jgi:hypothetical protein
MILLFERKIGSFGNYRELYQHITHSENLKLLEDHPQFAQDPWSFTVYSPERVAQQLQDTQKQYNIPVMWEAFEQKLGLLEICKGDCTKLIQIVLTPDVDVEGLRQSWCQSYCKTRGYALFEVDNPDDSNPSGDEHTGGQDDYAV